MSEREAGTAEQEAGSLGMRDINELTQDEMAEDELITPVEAAALLKISVRRVWHLVREYKVHKSVLRIGGPKGDIRFFKKALIDELRPNPPAAAD